MLKAKNKFMRAAIKEAYKGITNGDGGPFGAVIVKEGKIVGRGHNKVLKNNDPTCHGEMMAIRDACKKLGTFDLSGCELYTTGYPCPQCMGATQWSRIKRVFYSCNLKDTAEIGFDDQEFYDNPLVPEEMDRESGLKLYEDYTKTNPKKY